MNVLLVEDDRDTAEMIVMILRRAYGATVRWVDRGDLAMLALLTNPEYPDLVILDCHLPGLKGPEVADQIRAHDPQVPLLAYSCDASMAHEFDDVERCLFLSKPFRVTELLMTVDLTLSDAPAQPRAQAGGL